MAFGPTNAGASVERVKDIFLAGGVPYGKELTESWGDLRARVTAGDFSGIHISDYKAVTLETGETAIAEVAGIDQYYAPGNAYLPHHIDFISRDGLASHAMAYNSTNTNNGTGDAQSPYLASSLFRTLNAGVLEELPEDLRACMIPKYAQAETRYSSGGALDSDNGFAWANIGYLWLPTEVEVFGFPALSEPYLATGAGCCCQYPIFRGGTKHIIKRAGDGGAVCNWWLLSASRMDHTTFCNVDTNGGIAHTMATEVLSVPLCFRIG